MAKKTRTKTITTCSWWLEGEECCTYCHQNYVYETECYCVGCDVTLCTECVTSVKGEHLCPECNRGEEQ